MWSSRLSRIEIRVEDVVGAAITTFLVAIAGIGALKSPFNLNEDDNWDLSFILLPVALLILWSAARYAIDGGTPREALATGRRIGATIRDWFPFLFVLLGYEAFNTLIWKRISPRDFDRELLALDLRMWGTTPSIPMQAWITPLVTDAMTIFYFLHLVATPLLALLLYLRKRQEFRAFLLATLVAAGIGMTGYVTVPAVGPSTAFPELYSRALDSSVPAILPMIDAARAPRDVFPSLHVGLSTVVLIFAFRHRRSWGLIALPFVLGNWVSTLYLRYHYMVDIFAGWLLAPLSVWIAVTLLRLEARLRISKCSTPS